MSTTEEKIGYRQIFSQKEYCKLIFANLISRFGDSIDAIAFTWLVYAATKSASWAAVISACNMLPTILLQPFAGPAVERRNKKVIVITADIVRGLVVAALAFCYVTDRINPWMMLVFTMVISTVEAFCMPASTAIIPKVLDMKYYEYGMSFNSVGSTVMQLLGTGAAGVIIGCFGVHIAIFIDAVTFFGAAAVKLTMKVRKEAEERSGEATDHSAFEQYKTDLKEGLKYMASKRIFLNLGMLAFLVNGMLVPVNVFLAPLVSDVLGQSSELLSVIGVMISLGTILGSLIFPKLSGKLSSGRFVFATGLIISASMSLMTMGSCFRNQTVLVYVWTGIMGTLIGGCASLLSAFFSVQFMKCIDEAYLARAGAICGAVSTAAMPAISFLLSGIVAFVSVKNLIIASGVLCGIIFIIFRIRKIPFSEE